MKIGEKYAARNASSDDNMVPLINVVFLMLVFFMVAGQIQKADPIAVIPPQSINDNRAATDPNIEIVLGADDSLYVDDKLFAVEDVQAYLEQQFTSAPNKDAFWVQIKADGAISLEKLRPVFNQVRLAGLTKVSLATQLERGSK
ncbi:MAG: biopolymer transporter ExbD [Gammaproteobacteria bacterium]|jgi:biopolymer transport protein ExbD|uniref:ExbD/TolR family protein n=1 Tax=Marinomonas polaris TaxID=293552 RepID=UPI001D353309|nr:biopolymer transporter ExbD [Gammaproteobacteria bacterium]MBU1466540.1 biopolymer transporter ExbD [Gammaproteobacteria bacterium]MBU2021959.1 biopolymer transporter ExbD [Gammaproteobacteria bacterium]MBU2239182.1 biopolymer transporter ExbD [Gammaproteobacteria bacterium]MBU2317320.1 biopolymer transporter ExbD [Gammaproteobacteria bacterium]|tara:strand:- start:1967 stop:2398 length:432 start_codon:yes stop_codon:yes gene_type:complete